MAAAGPIQSPSQTSFELNRQSWEADIAAKKNEVLGSVQQVFDACITTHPTLAVDAPKLSSASTSASATCPDDPMVHSAPAMDIPKLASPLTGAEIGVALESTTIRQDDLHVEETQTQLACQSTTDALSFCAPQAPCPIAQTANLDNSKSTLPLSKPETPAIRTPVLNSKSKSTAKPPEPKSTEEAHRHKTPHFVEEAEGAVAAVAASALSIVQYNNHSNTLKATSKIDIISPCTIDAQIRSELKKPVNKEGHIYILKSSGHFPNEPPLLKIGMAKDLRARMEELRSNCGISDLTQVVDIHDYPLDSYWKVEKLVHIELQNFKRKYPCKKCKSKKGESTEHQEWFAVSEEVALKTVQRWRNFAKARPWDENGLLKRKWSSMINGEKMEEIGPDANEQWGDSEKRDKRWTKWLDEGMKL